MTLFSFKTTIFLYDLTNTYFEGTCRVLCYSEGREQKERAINALQEKRFLDALGQLQKSVVMGSILLPEKVAQRLGRLKERHPVATQKMMNVGPVRLLRF